MERGEYEQKIRTELSELEKNSGTEGYSFFELKRNVFINQQLIISPEIVNLKG